MGKRIGTVRPTISPAAHRYAEHLGLVGPGDEGEEVGALREFVGGERKDITPWEVAMLLIESSWLVESFLQDDGDELRDRWVVEITGLLDEQVEHVLGSRSFQPETVAAARSRILWVLDHAVEAEMFIMADGPRAIRRLDTVLELTMHAHDAVRSSVDPGWRAQGGWMRCGPDEDEDGDVDN